MAATKIVQTATKDHRQLLKEIDKRYMGSSSIYMKVNKKDIVEALGSEKNFSGELWLKQGKLRLQLKEDKTGDDSLVIIDGKYIWLISPPPKEFKNAKTQVARASMETEQARGQGLLQILNKGGVLKYFSVYGVYPSGDKITYFLNPKKKSVELKKAEVVVNRKDKTMVELSYKDSNDNETIFKFSETDFNKNISENLLSYNPPKNADVTNY